MLTADANARAALDLLKQILGQYPCEASVPVPAYGSTGASSPLWYLTHILLGSSSPEAGSSITLQNRAGG